MASSGLVYLAGVGTVVAALAIGFSSAVWVTGARQIPRPEIAKVEPDDKTSFSMASQSTDAAVVSTPAREVRIAIPNTTGSASASKPGTPKPSAREARKERQKKKQARRAKPDNSSAQHAAQPNSWSVSGNDWRR